MAGIDENITPDDQTRVIEFLSKPESYPHNTTDIETVETHISIIFLTGDKAYKLKKAIKFPYLDFRSLSHRHDVCENEVAINRRTAPEIYRRVIPVTCNTDGALEIDGDGETIEWLVEMEQFDQNKLLDRMVQKKELTPEIMESLADEIAHFHESAEITPTFGGSDGIGTVIENNAMCFKEPFGEIFDSKKIAQLNEMSQQKLLALSDHLDNRRAQGFVRLCHGDLHLRNIVYLNGKPTLFDAIEFSERLSSIDTFYDLAFLLMDLDHRNIGELANTVLNRYLARTVDFDGMVCLPLFLSMRAAIRAHVTAAAVATGHHTNKTPLIDDSKGLLELALGYLKPTTPRLIAIGGLSGSGKSSLARDLAPLIDPAPGAYIARSDWIRKRIAGVDFLTTLGANGYSAAMTDKTYEAVFTESRKVLEMGHSVVADAVFAKPDQRQAIENIAHDIGVPFTGIWLEASSEVMADRISNRTSDASDATTDVLQKQMTYDLGTISWHTIKSTGSREDVLKNVHSLI